MNKGNLTLLASVALTIAGYFLGDPWLSMGLFALSGALTNAIAIHMIFERVPGIYGSGVIQLQFDTFKRSIHDLVMDQFFKQEIMQRLLGDLTGSGEEGEGGPMDPESKRKLMAALDLDLIFDRIRDAVLASKLGGALNMFGGPALLEEMRPSIREKLGATLGETLDAPRVQQAIAGVMSSKGEDFFEDLREKVASIVRARLGEMTPAQVKDLVKRVIAEHLGWLVLWGGVFGALIGLAAWALRLA